MFRLRRLKERRSAGEQRRRADRRARRAGLPTVRVMPAPIVVTRSPDTWDESYVQRKLDRLQARLVGWFSWPEIRRRLMLEREHLIACAKASTIVRCRFTRESVDAKGRKRVGGECGGRIRERQTWQGERKFLERACAVCGRVEQ